ncbi:hypothetical protein HN51_068132 [Arachis hypogaea]
MKTTFTNQCKNPHYFVFRFQRERVFFSEIQISNSRLSPLPAARNHTSHSLDFSDLNLSEWYDFLFRS